MGKGDIRSFFTSTKPPGAKNDTKNSNQNTKPKPEQSKKTSSETKKSAKPTPTTDDDDFVQEKTKHHLKKGKENKVEDGSHGKSNGKGKHTPPSEKAANGKGGKSEGSVKSKTPAKEEEMDSKPNKKTPESGKNSRTTSPITRSRSKSDVSEVEEEQPEVLKKRRKAAVVDSDDEEEKSQNKTSTKSPNSSSTHASPAKKTKQSPTASKVPAPSSDNDADTEEQETHKKSTPKHDKKTPEKADKKTPDSKSDKKVTNKKTPDNKNETEKKTPDTKKETQKKTPDNKKDTDKKTPDNNKKQTDKKTPDNKKDTEKKTPEAKKDTEKKTPENKKETEKKTPDNKKETQKKTPDNKSAEKKAIEAEKSPSATSPMTRSRSKSDVAEESVEKPQESKKRKKAASPVSSDVEPEINVAEKVPEKKTPEKKTPEKKTPEKKTPEKKTPEKKTPEKKTPEKKAEKRKQARDEIEDEDMTEVDEDWKEKEATAKRKAPAMESPVASTSKKLKLEFAPSPSKRQLDFNEPKSAVKTEPTPKPAVKTEPVATKRDAKPATPSKPEAVAESKIKAETPAEPKQKPRGNPRWYGARPAPPNRGLKPLPTGEENCLAGKQFIVSGILDSLERDEVHDLIKSFGGHVCKSVTKGCSHAVIGSEPGEKKLAEIIKKKLPMLSEDDLFELIRTSKGKKVAGKPVKTVPVSPVKPKQQPTPVSTSDNNNNNNSNNQGNNNNQNNNNNQLNNNNQSNNNNQNNNNNNNRNKGKQPESTSSYAETQLWVDKYKPTKVTDLVGNNAAIKTLQDWLNHWNPEQKNERAALLSGPPGIGKTSSANIVARSCGFEAVEFNASDQRNKKHIEGFFDGLAGSRSIGGFFSPMSTVAGGSHFLPPNPTKKICMIMDEVDGMSGSDRGGVAELIKVIGKTKIPIICICNDVHSTKVKSLVKHCKDLRFSRPMIKSAQPRVKAIAQQEGLHIDDLAIEKVLESAHGDMRQALTILQMWSRSAKAKGERIDHFEAKRKLQNAEKDMEISPFVAIRNLMTGQGVTDLNSRLDMYFVDFGIMNLFVQENYLVNRPLPHNDLKHVDALENVCKAAEFISDGDVVDRVVRSQMRWDLLNTHGVLSTVAPSYYVQGGMGQPFFPSWLGKNSTATRRNRMLSEIQMHMRSVASGDKQQVLLDYLPVFQQSLAKPLVEQGPDGIESIITMMDEYGLTREDRDAIFELAPDACEPMLAQIPATVKSAFTRRYNEESHLVKAGATSAKVSSSRASSNEYEEEEPAYIETEVATQDDDEAEEEDEFKADKFIKVGKGKAKGKGKGKGKATGGAKAKTAGAKPKAKTAGANKRGKKEGKK